MARRPQWLEDRLRRSPRRVIDPSTVDLQVVTNDIAPDAHQLRRTFVRAGVSRTWPHQPRSARPDMRRVNEDRRSRCRHAFIVQLSPLQRRLRPIHLLP